MTIGQPLLGEKYGREKREIEKEKITLLIEATTQPVYNAGRAAYELCLTNLKSYRQLLVV